MRVEYSNEPLLESDPIVQAGPFNLFHHWLNKAREFNCLEPNAMTLSTIEFNDEGIPCPVSRFVLLKSLDHEGFVWFTNYHSRKGKNLDENNRASLTFWWGDLQKSVRVEGIVKKVTESESDEYFRLRPRDAQIGAWSSSQSEEIGSREELEAKEAAMRENFKNVDNIPRPPHWGGFRLIPLRMEFWKGRKSRVHDRLVFSRNEITDENWTLKRLQP